MAITFVATGAVATGTNSITVGLPSGLANDDLLLLVIETANQATATPSGWSIATGSPQGIGTAAGTAATRLDVFYRVVDGTETSVSIANSVNHRIGRMIAYRGVDPASPVNTGAGSTKGTASTTATFPSITTTADNCMVLLIEAHALPDANSTAVTSGQTMASLESITERLDNNTNAGNGGGFSLAEGIKVTAGSTGTGTATITSSVGAHITLALREAPPAQDLTPDLYTNTNVVYEPSLTVGAVNLDVPPVENTSVFYTATVGQTGGAQDVQPGLYENAQTFFAPTVGRGPVSLTATRYDNLQTFFAPSVTPGAVTLTATRYDNGQTFYAATVSVGAVTLTPARYDNAQTFYSPVVTTGSAVLAPPRYDNTNTFYAHTLTAGAVTLAPARLDNTNTFYAASIGAGASALSPSLVENTNQFYTPTVIPGVITLAPVRVENEQALYAPSVSVGAVTLTADRFDNASTIYPPQISDVPTQNITFPNWVEPGWVEPGWVAWPYINANQFFGAALTQSAPAQTAGGGRYIRSDRPLQWVSPLPFADREARRAKRRRDEILLVTQ